MATIVGAIATSHAPTVGFPLDTDKQSDPNWAPIFEGYKRVRKWLAEKGPDVLFLIYNDLITSFFFEHYSHFALGVGEYYPVADEGGDPRSLPPIKGHRKLAAHIAAGLVADEFDLSCFQGKGLDHGCFSPLSVLWPHEPDWPGAIVPLQVGVLRTPTPTARLCYKLGKSLRKAILSYPENLKMAIVATRGLSHHVHGERDAFNNAPWALEFMERLERDPESLTNITAAEYRRLGGWEDGEVIMLLIVRGAMASKVRKLHESYDLSSMTAIGIAIYEDDVTD
jgi:gallate dioxygenase